MAVIPPTLLKVNNIGKKFRKEWIFRNISFELSSGACMSVSGTNGSGKSTFLRIVSGFMTSSEGTIEIRQHENMIPAEQHFRYLSFAAPYLDMVDDMTLEENIRYYAVHKPLRGQMSASEVAETMQLSKHLEKAFRSFSSGMKQRVKLGLAILSDTPLLLLDEPLSNMDADGFLWYRNLMEDHKSERITMICSNNVEAETEFCTESLNITDYKG